jgi:hypothetical protein
MRQTVRGRCAAAYLVVGLGLGAWPVPADAVPQVRADPPQPAAGQAAPTDLDTFMARVLQRRDENWRKLHDYILSETETLSIDGPGKLPLNGFRREYTWYVRDGYLIRSPVRFDGVTTPETERRKYEEHWMNREKAREARARSKRQPTPAETTTQATADAPSLEQLVDQRSEPRLISEAYFLRFKFEPGNYYLAGREQFEGRDVLRIEYYPTGLFGHHKTDGPTPPAKPAPAKPAKPDRRHLAYPDEQEIERKLNKVALVTLWVDPSEHQIVKYTFDNTEFDFLPGRWLVRVSDVTATMTMARVLGGVWLPGQISMHAGLTLASGNYAFQYGRTFYDYKKAEVGARVRILPPKRP